MEEAQKRNKIFVPERSCNALLKILHCTETDHLKQAKFIVVLNQRFYWKNLKKDAFQILEQCEICACLSNIKKYCPLRPILCKYTSNWYC